MEEAVHADAVLQAESHLHLRGDVSRHLLGVHILDQVRAGLLVQPPLDGSDGTGYLDIVRIALGYPGQGLAARVGVTPPHLQHVFRHDVLVIATEEVRQLLQLLAGRVLQYVPHRVQRVLRQREAGLRTTRRAGKSCAHQRSGQRHVRMLAHPLHNGFQGAHPSGGIPGCGIIAGCFGRQLPEGDERHTLRIVAQGQTAVVQRDDDGVEDGPRDDSDKNQFGKQPAVAAATGPESM